MKLQQLLRGEPIVEAEIFWEKTNATADLHIAYRRAEYERVAASRLHQAEEHFDRRALPRAVRTEETEDRAVRNLQREPSHGGLWTKSLLEILRFDCVVRGCVHGVFTSPFIELASGSASPELP
jgi:hypothetical protein